MVCQKLSSDTELVICYNFSDFQNSIVKLLPITPADFIDKRITQMFKNDEENDIWWEQGIVISKDLSNSAGFIVSLFDNEDYDECESSLNVHYLSWMII